MDRCLSIRWQRLENGTQRGTYIMNQPPIPPEPVHPFRADLDDSPTVVFKAGQTTGTQVFSRFVLRSILGSGRSGVVWLAWDQRLEREVALKFLPEVLVRDPVALAAMRKEAQRCLDLTHGNIVRVYDFHEEEGRAAIAMELLAGGSLASRLAAHPLRCFDAAELSTWVADAGAALAHAHGLDIVHRDIKPSNLMLDAEGRLKVADFDLAISLRDSPANPGQEGVAAGTLRYLSPQQLQGESPSLADDVYSFGASLYELLAGEPPFRSPRLEQQILQDAPVAINERRRALGRPDLPEAWADTIMACLRKDPGERPGSIALVLAGLGLGEKLAEAPQPPRRPARWWGVAVAGLLLLLVGAIVLIRRADSGPVAAGSSSAAGSEASPRPSSPAPGGPVAARVPSGIVRVGTDTPPRMSIRFEGQRELAGRRVLANGGETLTLPSGAWLVTVERPGWDPVERLWEVSDGAELQVLDPGFRESTLEVVVNPPGAFVHVDGRELGPISEQGIILEAWPADRARAITVKRPGFQRQTWVDSAGQGTHRREFVLEPAVPPVAGSPWQTVMGATEAGVPISFQPVTPRTLILGGPIPDQPGQFQGLVFTLSQTFWMQTTEVSVGQWLAGGGVADLVAGQPDNLPARGMSRQAALDWAAQFTALAHEDGLLPLDYAFHLPTEEEWEMAARGRKLWQRADQFVVSPGLHPSLANYGLPAQPPGVRPVGSYRANDLGLHDLAGNVAEWCANAFTSVAWGQIARESPERRVGLPAVYRGGAWSTPAADMPVHRRWSSAAGEGRPEVGFRLILRQSSVASGGAGPSVAERALLVQLLGQAR